jgi:acyl dehydratase
MAEASEQAAESRGAASDVVGRPTVAATVHVERGAVQNFALAVTDANPVYADRRVAQDAGLGDIPAPPTFTFALQNCGKFAEEQPPDPTGGRNVMMEVIGTLMANGGMVLHGEQEFVYHRPVVVGDTLHADGKVVDHYTKQSGERTMTFLVMETVYSDDAGEPVVTERFNLIHRS